MRIVGLLPRKFRPDRVDRPSGRQIEARSDLEGERIAYPSVDSSCCGNRGPGGAARLRGFIAGLMRFIRPRAR